MIKEIDLSNIIIKKYYSLINQILRHDYTHYWITGGRGSTKSSFLSIALIILLISRKNINALVLRKVSGTLQNSVYNQIQWATNILELNDLFKFKISPLEIIYKPTGQTIFFRGADDPIKIKSIKPKYGYIGVTWFEELDQFKGEDEIRNILQSSNRGGNYYWNFYSYNPPRSRDNWVNIAVNEEGLRKIQVHTSYLDVPVEWLGEQFFLEAEHLKKTKPDKYEHEYLGIPIGLGGAVFDNIENREITDEEIGKINKFYYGMDFGFAVDPFAWVKVSYNTDTKTLFIIDEIYQIKLRDNDAIKKIKDKFKGNIEYIVADSSSPKTIDYFNCEGLKVYGAKKGADSVNRGLKWLQDLNKIVIDKKRTPNTFKEFFAYEYETNKNGEFISSYPDKNNHAIDAIRYALEKIINSNVIRWG